VTWTPEQLAFARAWSAALFAFGKQAFVRGTITDVVAWLPPDDWKRSDSYSALNVALVGDGVKVSRAFGYFNAEGGGDVDLGAMSGPISYAAAKLLGAKEMARDIGRDKVSLTDLLSRLEGQAAYEFCDTHSIEMPFTEVSMRLIIEPGYPWPENDVDGLVYWSAKKNKTIMADRPAWLINVPEEGDDRVIRLGVNPCAVFPAEPQAREWPLWGRSGKQDLIVSHSMTLLAAPSAVPTLGPQFHKQADTAISNIRACGGLLFPSLAVGAIPSSNFGPITLVGHLGLALDGLKPLKERGRDATSWVYAHDAWTVTTRDLMGVVAKRLFDELHGHEDYMYGYNIWSLGPPAELFGGPSEGSTPLKTIRELVTAAKRRGATFRRGMSHEEFAVANEAVAGTVDKYSYCEAKARRVISLDEFPAMIGPHTLRDQIRAFAKGTGYKGKIVILEDPFNVAYASDDLDYQLFQWSWLVADAIKKLGDPMEI
jgi:hypothetical protein